VTDDAHIIRTVRHFIILPENIMRRCPECERIVDATVLVCPVCENEVRTELFSTIHEALKDAQRKSART
jgi:hypothetical protein